MISNQEDVNTSIFENAYDRDILLDDLKYGTSKTQKSILIIGAIFLVSDFISLSNAHLLQGNNIIYMLLIPLMYAGLAFLAKFKPLLAIILATVLFTGIISMSIIAFGVATILNGLIMKAVIVYFILTGFRNANDAESARKKLEIFR